MGDVPGMRLVDLQRQIRTRMGCTKQLASGSDEVVRTALRCWPERTMAAFAAKRHARDPSVINAVHVIWAKVREDLEARWGVDATTTAALDLLVQPIVLELANVWFASSESRIAMRGCIVEAARPAA